MKLTECAENHFLSFSSISEIPLCARRGRPLQRQCFNSSEPSTKCQLCSHAVLGDACTLQFHLREGLSLKTPGDVLTATREEERGGIFR